MNRNNQNHIANRLPRRMVLLLAVVAAMVAIGAFSAAAYAGEKGAGQTPIKPIIKKQLNCTVKLDKDTYLPGETVTFTVTPKKGYALWPQSPSYPNSYPSALIPVGDSYRYAEITRDPSTDTKAGSFGKFSFTMPDVQPLVYGYAAIPQKIKVNVGTGGQASASYGNVYGDYTTNHKKIYLTIKPNQGYKKKSITVTDARGNTVGLEEDRDTTAMFVMPETDVTVDVTFAPDDAKVGKGTGRSSDGQTLLGAGLAAQAVADPAAGEALAAELPAFAEAAAEKANKWIQPGDLLLYDKNFDPVADPEQAFQKMGIAYPVSLQFTASGALTANYLTDFPTVDSYYQEGNRMAITYSDGTSEVYECANRAAAGLEYYLLNQDGNPTDQYQTFARDAMQPLTREGDEVFFIMADFFKVDGDSYMFFKASEGYPVETLQPSVGSADVFDTTSKHEIYGTYTGKAKTIDPALTEVYPGDVSQGLPVVTSVDPVTDMKAIGTHVVEVKIDNANGYFTSDTLYGYYRIYPKKVTGLKVSSPKKKTVKVSWKYKDKANYKAIDGYLVQVYDQKDNLVASKKVKKAKKTVAIKKNKKVKLKSGKKYYVVVSAYKAIDDGVELDDGVNLIDGADDAVAGAVVFDSLPAVKKVKVK